VGMVFNSLKLAIGFYAEYGYMGGFDVRLNTQTKYNSGKIKTKHVICNRGGTD
jgi:hypothetical protein